MNRPQTVRELREALNLSLAEFAKLIGVHRNSISMWESGKGISDGYKHELRKLADKYVAGQLKPKRKTYAPISATKRLPGAKTKEQIIKGALDRRVKEREEAASKLRVAAANKKLAQKAEVNARVMAQEAEPLIPLVYANSVEIAPGEHDFKLTFSLGVAGEKAANVVHVMATSNVIDFLSNYALDVATAPKRFQPKETKPRFMPEEPFGKGPFPVRERLEEPPPKKTVEPPEPPAIIPSPLKRLSDEVLKDYPWATFEHLIEERDDAVYTTLTISRGETKIVLVDWHQKGKGGIFGITLLTPNGQKTTTRNYFSVRNHLTRILDDAPEPVVEVEEPQVICAECHEPILEGQSRVDSGSSSYHATHVAVIVPPHVEKEMAAHLARRTAFCPCGHDEGHHGGGRCDFRCEECTPLTIKRVEDIQTGEDKFVVEPAPPAAPPAPPGEISW